MKLNPDLVRDLLLTVEDICDFNHCMEYSKTSTSFERLNKYSHDEIVYHVKQCSQNNLIDGVTYYNNGEYFRINDLTPKGHTFIANIKDDNIWSTVKSHAHSMGVSSLSALTKIAINVVTNIISNHFS